MRWGKDYRRDLLWVLESDIGPANVFPGLETVIVEPVEDTLEACFPLALLGESRDPDFRAMISSRRHYLLPFSVEAHAQDPPMVSPLLCLCARASIFDGLAMDAIR